MGLWVSALLHQIADNPKEKPKYPQRNYAIFLDEDESLLADDPLPSVDEITYFVGSIVSVGELAPQSCIMAIAYLSRIRQKLHIHLLNWRRVVLSTLILGCKVWEEHPVFNTDFNELFPEMSGKVSQEIKPVHTQYCCRLTRPALAVARSTREVSSQSVTLQRRPHGHRVREVLL